MQSGRDSEREALCRRVCSVVEERAAADVCCFVGSTAFSVWLSTFRSVPPGGDCYRICPAGGGFLAEAHPNALLSARGESRALHDVADAVGAAPSTILVDEVDATGVE